MRLPFSLKKRLKQLYPADPERVKKELEVWEKEHPGPGATLQIAADHIDFIRKVAEIDHIGIGSDFDGIDNVPVGFEDVSTFPALFVELLKRGYTKEEVRKVAGFNLLRVMKQCEQVALTLKAEKHPIELPLEKLPTDDD